VAEAYTQWLLSTPFDAGMTTFETIGAAARMAQSTQFQSHLHALGYAKVMQQAAVRCCSDSKSNGCLMRASPIGVWARDLPDELIAEIAMSDCALTNPAFVCQHAVASYCIAIASLMHAPHDSIAALNRVARWIDANGGDEIKGWWKEVQADVLEEYYPHGGFIKIAWKHAYRHLKAETAYSEAISITISGGGDTDTNACIVGGLMGAFWGANQLPLAMREKVLQCNTSKGRPRPDFLSTRQLPELAFKLVYR
jgi:ADP-ribosylglycohydrolase